MNKLTKVIYYLILILILTGCTNNKSNNDTTDKKNIIEIDMVHCWPEKELIHEIIDNYNTKNEGIKVNVEYIPVTQYYNTLVNRSASGVLPDIFLGWPGSSMEWFYDMNLTADLSNQLWVKRLNDKEKQDVTYKDKIMMLPINKTFICIGYNKQIFDRFDLEKPRNYEELEYICNKVKENNITPVTLGSRDSSGYIYSTWIMAASEIYSKDPQYDYKLLNGTGKMNDNEWRSILTRLYEWQKNGFISKDQFALNRMDVCVDEFIKGNAAMFVLGSWEIDTIYSRAKELNKDFEMDFFPFPTIEGQGILLCASGEGLCVNSNSRYLKESLEFLDDFSSIEVNKYINNSMNSFSAFNDINIGYNQHLDKLKEYKNNNKATWGYIDAGWPRIIADMYTNLIPEYLSDKITLDEMLNKLDDAWLNIKKKEN